MNPYFSLARFSFVIQQFWFENRKAMLLMFLALGSILAIWMSLFLSFRNPGIFREKSQVWNYFIFLLFSSCLSANFLFSNLNNKARCVNYLLLPASAIEKMICSFLFGVIIFWIGYTSIFYIIDFTMVSIANDQYGTHWPVINIFQIDRYENPLINQPCSVMFYETFLAQAISVVCSLYFKNHSFFKTAIVMLVIWVAIVFAVMTSPVFLPTGGFYGSIAVYEVLDYAGNKLVVLPHWFRIFVTVFFSFGLTGTLWILAYFKLREREVA
jgi:hypothetical protein